jgi:peptidase MA superfamily protein
VNTRFLICLLLLWGLAGGAPAQERIRLADPPLEIVYAPNLEGAAHKLRASYPELLADIRRKLDLRYERPLTVKLVRSHEEFVAEVKRYGGGEVGPNVAAIAFSFSDVIVLKSEAWRTLRVASMDVVFQHEILHCVLGDFVRRHPQALIPTWLNEGIAQWVSEASFKNDGGALASALSAGELPPLSELEKSFPEGEGATALAYAQSLSFVRYISRWGAENELRRGNLRVLLRQLARGKRVDQAIEAMTGMSFEEFEESWRGEVSRELGITARQFPQLAFGVFVAVASLLIWATLRERRRRAYAEMERRESAENEEFGIGD